MVFSVLFGTTQRETGQDGQYQLWALSTQKQRAEIMHASRALLILIPLHILLKMIKVS